MATVKEVKTLFTLDAKKFTDEEIKLLSKSSYVKNVRKNRLALTYEFRCILYNEWIKQPSGFRIR